jgi:hypothetical protein
VNEGLYLPDNVQELGEQVDGFLYSALQSTRDYSWIVHFDTRLPNGEDGGENEIVASSLFDTGALGANYVSKRMFKKLKDQIDDTDVIQKKTKVGLAGTATADSDTVVVLTLEFQG